MNQREHHATLVPRKPGPADHAWYRSINAETPELIASTGPESHRYARLVPYRFRRFHETYAKEHGYFWKPCPLCGHHFGGHETGKHIPNPLSPPNGYVGICSECSRRQP